jgi:2-polyprenyl-3-methyl-5-hydroxy-6-metoxy-1,4-benzoquinol methylase
LKSTPLDYATWRGTPLGEVTERLERRAVFDLSGPVAGLDLLDVGCGTGAYSLEAARAGARVFGVDRSWNAIEAARASTARSGLRASFAAASAGDLPFRGKQFDLVLAVTVLCFVPDARKAVSEMARVLRPGGLLVLGDLGRWSTWAAWRRVKGWIGNRTWAQARFHSVDELRELTRTAGLTPTRWRAAVFNPPLDALAKAMEPLDEFLGRRTSVGAAFLAVAAKAG